MVIGFILYGCFYGGVGPLKRPVMAPVKGFEVDLRQV